MTGRCDFCPLEGELQEIEDLSGGIWQLCPKCYDKAMARADYEMERSKEEEI